MPVPFGFSVGDCISVCILIKDAIKALDNIHGSSSEYQTTIRELWALDRALLEVVSLAEGFETTVELNALSHTARRVAEQCRACIEGFLEKVKKYEQSLKNGGSGNRLKDGWRKVGWALCEKDDLEKFRAEINALSSTINMLLMTASVSLTKLNEKNMRERIDDAKRTTESVADENMTVLIQVKDAIDAQGRVAMSVGERCHAIEATIGKQITLLGQVKNSVVVQKWATQSLADRMKYFLTLGTELKTFMTRILTLNFRSYNILVDLQTRVPREFGPCWIQEPITLTDALGRVAPIHLELINNWDVLESVLIARFKDVPGEQKVKQKEYALQDRGSSKDVTRSRSFDTCFFPGRHLDMSMVFANASSSGNSCPGCKIIPDQSDSEAVTCKGCDLWYQRVEEIGGFAKEDLGSEALLHSAVIGNQVTSSLDSRISMKRRHESMTVDDDITSFKRVRLLEQKYKRHRRSNDLSDMEFGADELSGAILDDSIFMRNGHNYDTTAHERSRQTSSYWSVPECTDFPVLLRHFGTDWTGIAKHMMSKTHIMVKNYYQRQVDSGKMKEWEEITQDADKKHARGESTGPLPSLPIIPKRRYDLTPIHITRPSMDSDEDLPIPPTISLRSSTPPYMFPTSATLNVEP